MEGNTPEGEGEFGFVTLDRTHTLSSFEAYAHWAKGLHFGTKSPMGAGQVGSVAAEQSLCTRPSSSRVQALASHNFLEHVELRGESWK